MTAPTNPNPLSVLLANLVVSAMEIHENSYDYAAALAEATANVKAHEAARRANPGDLYASLCVGTYSNHYKIDRREAAAIACKDEDPMLALTVHLLMEHGWNDIQSWAKEVCGRTFRETEAHLNFSRDLNRIYGLSAGAPVEDTQGVDPEPKIEV